MVPTVWAQTAPAQLRCPVDSATAERPERTEAELRGGTALGGVVAAGGGAGCLIVFVQEPLSPGSRSAEPGEVAVDLGGALPGFVDGPHDQ